MKRNYYHSFAHSLAGAFRRCTCHYFFFAEAACVNLDHLKVMEMLEIQLLIFISTGSFSSYFFINF